MGTRKDESTNPVRVLLFNSLVYIGAIRKKRRTLTGFVGFSIGPIQRHR
jgi:hypothetical protein